MRSRRDLQPASAPASAPHLTRTLTRTLALTLALTQARSALTKEAWDVDAAIQRLQKR